MLQELEDGLHLSSGPPAWSPTLPVLCFAALGFAGPAAVGPLPGTRTCSAGAMATMAAGLVLPRGRRLPSGCSCVGTVLAMTGGALGNVLLPSLVKRYFPHRTGLLVARTARP